MGHIMFSHIILKIKENYSGSYQKYNNLILLESLNRFWIIVIYFKINKYHTISYSSPSSRERNLGLGKLP